MSNMVVKSFRRIVDTLHHKYPYLTREEILDFLIEQSMSEFDKIMKNLTLPDPKRIRIQRLSRLKRTKKNLREGVIDKYERENEVLSFYSRLKRNFEKRQDDQDGVAKSDNREEVESSSNQLQQLVYDGTDYLNLSRSYQQASSFAFGTNLFETKWIDKVNKSITKRNEEDKPVVDASIKSIFGLLELDDEKERSNGK